HDAVRFDNGSESFISDCKIHDISGNGIYIFRSASISVDNSEFWGIKQAALAACGSGAGLTATKVSIHDTFSHGVLTEQQAQSTIIDSDIQSCGDDCVAVNFTSNSNGTISGCKIHSNSGHGVGASKSSVVEIVDSEFWGIKQIALAAGGAGTVLTATKVSIHDTFSHGVKVQNNAQCVIRDSEIQSCSHDCAFLYFGSSSK
ncbi:right-handed parallel beta-helix repeat-containing protein, partial [Cutibacterium acnes]